MACIPGTESPASTECRTHATYGRQQHYTPLCHCLSSIYIYYVYICCVPAYIYIYVVYLLIYICCVPAYIYMYVYLLSGNSLHIACAACQPVCLTWSDQSHGRGRSRSLLPCPAMSTLTSCLACTVRLQHAYVRPDRYISASQAGG
jgi:hypothetical protein